jgi:hypothetical protein
VFLDVKFHSAYSSVAAFFSYCIREAGCQDLLTGPATRPDQHDDQCEAQKEKISRIARREKKLHAMKRIRNSRGNRLEHAIFHHRLRDHCFGTLSCPPGFACANRKKDYMRPARMQEEKSQAIPYSPRGSFGDE